MRRKENIWRQLLFHLIQLQEKLISELLHLHSMSIWILIVLEIKSVILVWPWICSVAKTDLELLTLHPCIQELLELHFHWALGGLLSGLPYPRQALLSMSYKPLTLLKNIIFSSQFYKKDKIWRKILKISYILFIICIVDVLPKRYWKINSKSMESKNDFGGWQ